jgi:hypothetical protein
MEEDDDAFALAPILLPMASSRQSCSASAVPFPLTMVELTVLITSPTPGHTNSLRPPNRGPAVMWRHSASCSMEVDADKYDDEVVELPTSPAPILRKDW